MLAPSRLALPLIAALALGSTGPAAAQDTTAPEGDPAEQAPAPDSPGTTTLPGGELSTGQVGGQAAGADGEPQIYVREEHGSWQVRCLRAPEGQTDPCQLYQRLSDQQGNPTADVNFFDLPEGEGEIVAGATVLTPLQTLLTAQVSMRVDDGEPRRYPFSFCDRSGCYARMGFTEADMAAFRRGAEAQIVVRPAAAPDQPAELTMSLSGFTAGIAAVEVAEPE